MKEDLPKDRSYYCDKYGFLAEKREKLRSHMDTVNIYEAEKIWTRGFW